MDEQSTFIETPFKELMSSRIREILLVCSDYDRFMLEEDGRIDEQLFQEYISLSLRYPPKFTQASTARETMDMMKEKYYDLVIVMLSVGDISPVELSRKIKEIYPQKPVVLLTHISTKETMRILQVEDQSALDLIFSWQGNSNIMLAMVKLLEDRMNVDQDVSILGVQSIILVEDSVRYYSSYLPIIYETLIRQARNAMKEGLNEWEQTMRMRGRPKILLARTYEEAMDLYEKYKSNLLGVISDIEYSKGGESNPRAGLLFCEHIRAEISDIPVLLQSSNIDHKGEAIEKGAFFIHKNSKTLLKRLERYIKENYGFGDFVFRDPETERAIGYARDLQTLHRAISTISDDVFMYHVQKNDFSKWLRARTFFSLARRLRALVPDDWDDPQILRDRIINHIQEFRTMRGRGVIAEFDSNRFDDLSFFSRIGSGSLGGKGRGLAFIDLVLKKNSMTNKYPGIIISIPRTIVITTEVFDAFMEENDLYYLALNETNDDEIFKAFQKAEFPEKFVEDLDAILREIIIPIAVRSSSLLEDSHHQPFAGVYATYMLKNNDKNPLQRRAHLLNAVKAVYASTYYQNSKIYMKSTNAIIEDEKMAVIIQEINGDVHGESFYPLVSGVARSLNFYPIEPEKAEDGIAEIAMGLGKTVVDGGTALRFSPSYPKKIIQLSDPQNALSSTQKKFYALDLSEDQMECLSHGDGNVIELPIEDAEDHGTLRWIASTFDFQNNRMRDGVTRKGRRVITMAGLLKYNQLPLAEIIKDLLELGQHAMNVPIEIEFAMTPPKLNPEGAPGLGEFSFLQIRPIVENSESEKTRIDEVPESALLYAEKAMGNGIYTDIQDIVYLRPENFDPGRTEEMGAMLKEINSVMIDNDRTYLLVVIGRLGSTDPWLGIPLGWADISQARVIVESGTRDFRVEPSQGTHFFQNITSLGCGYLTINPALGDGKFNSGYLDSLPAEEENDLLRVVRLNNPLEIKIDGKNSRALVLAHA